MVSSVFQDRRRSRAAVIRNAAIVAVTVVAISGIIALVTRSTTRTACDHARDSVMSAENRYHADFGAFTDEAGLHYAGVLSDSIRPFVKVRIVGQPGAASSYAVVSDDIC
jgi:hypothetical protein